MPKYIYLNNKDTTLTAALNSGITSLPVASLASNIINRTFVLDEVLKLTLYDNIGNIEVVDVVSGSNPTYTIVRGRESTTDQTWPIGTKVSLRLTAAELTDMPFSPSTSLLTLVKNAHTAQVNILAAANRANSTSVGTGTWIIDVTGAPAAWFCVVSGTTAASYAPVTFTDAPDLIKDGTALFLKVALTDTSTKKISNTSGIFIGDEAVSRTFSLAIGSAIATDSGVAIGSFNSLIANLGGSTCATGFGTVAINGEAIGDLSVAINGGYAPYYNSLSLDAVPLKHQQLFFNKPQCNMEGVLWSGPIDLTGGTTWTASALTPHGYSTKPTVINGFQYIRDDFDNFNYKKKFAGITYTPLAVGATQPTWATVDNGSQSDGNSDGSYYAVANVGHLIPIATKFMVTQVGFVAYDVSSVTVQPFISVGISGNNTKYVANVQTTGLTANDTMQIFTTVPGIADTLTVSINTLATGTRLLGQFFFKGFYAPSWF